MKRYGEVSVSLGTWGVGMAEQALTPPECGTEFCGMSDSLQGLPYRRVSVEGLRLVRADVRGTVLVTRARGAFLITGNDSTDSSRPITMTLGKPMRRAPHGRMHG
jgi:hypothetical protein